MRARLALLPFLRPWQHAVLVILNGDHRKNLVEPFPAHTELVLARVHRETEALLSRLAPHTSALLLQARPAVRSLEARNRAHLRNDRRRRGGSTNPRAPRFLDPPLAEVGLRTTLARNVVGAVGTFAGLQG